MCISNFDADNCELNSDRATINLFGVGRTFGIIVLADLQPSPIGQAFIFDHGIVACSCDFYAPSMTIQIECKYEGPQREKGIIYAACPISNIVDGSVVGSWVISSIGRSGCNPNPTGERPWPPSNPRGLRLSYARGSTQPALPSELHHVGGTTKFHKSRCEGLSV